MPPTRPRAGKLPRCAVQHGAFRIDRFAQPGLDLARRWRRFEPRGARRIALQPSEQRANGARGSERFGQLGQSRPVEYTAGHAKECQGFGKIGDGFRTEGIVGEQQCRQLGDLGEGVSDPLGVRGRGPCAQPRRAERTRGVLRHPLQRRREFQGLQHGG
jgi:hypothetical protein